MPLASWKQFHSSSCFFPLFRHPLLILQTQISHVKRPSFILQRSSKHFNPPRFLASPPLLFLHHYRSPSIPLFSVCLSTDGRSSWAGPEGEKLRKKKISMYPKQHIREQIHTASATGRHPKQPRRLGGRRRVAGRSDSCRRTLRSQGGFKCQGGYKMWTVGLIMWLPTNQS